MWIFPTFPTTLDKPQTLYSILNSYVNFGAETQTKIKDLTSAGRACIFDFDYPLSSKVNKEEFETNILNHYLMRRIGFDTPTAFKINLNAKLNEIMPKYNKLFDALDGWDLFSTGEVTTRTKNIQSSNKLTAQSSDATVNDLRSSDMPENKLADVRDAKYVSKYDYNQNNSNSASETNAQGQTGETETITRTQADEIKIYTEFMNKTKNIYTLIYKELDVLFYGLA